MESKFLFYAEHDRHGFGTPIDLVRLEAQEAACHRLRARIKSGNTLVRVEVKRKQD
jgi:hypothetical protein